MAVRHCSVPYGTLDGWSPWPTNPCGFGLPGLTWFVDFVNDKPLLYAGLGLRP